MQRNQARFQYSLRVLLTGVLLCGPILLLGRWLWHAWERQPAVPGILGLLLVAAVAAAGHVWLRRHVQWPQTGHLPLLAPREESTGE